MRALASTKTEARGNLAELFDLATLEPLLRSIVRFEGRRTKQPHDVRIERCWPMQAGGIRFEWSFRLSGTKRHRLVGVAGDRRYAQRSHPERPGRVTPRGIRRLRAYAPRYGMVVFSLDRDPRMPHMRRCLDPDEMAGQLRPFFADLGVPGNAEPARIVAQPLTDKAGRRAVIAYRPGGTRGARLRLLGKTFRNDRARDFETTYRRVGEQLLRLSGGRVGGPTVVGAIDDLRMALFAWNPGRSIANGAKLEATGLQSAIDVLGTLHRVELDDLPTFSVEDECAVARRWQAALVLAGHPAVDQTRVLFDALQIKSRAVPARALRTVHRDFYEKQLIWSARRTTLLDLDTLTLGDPCLDLATFFAHAYLDRLRSSESKPDYAALVGTLLPRYERAMGAVERDALAFYSASAAIRLGAVHALRCATRKHAPALWSLAESLLKKTAGRRPRSLPARRSPRRIATGRKVV